MRAKPSTAGHPAASTHGGVQGAVACEIPHGTFPICLCASGYDAGVHQQSAAAEAMLTYQCGQYARSCTETAATASCMVLCALCLNAHALVVQGVTPATLRKHVCII